MLWGISMFRALLFAVVAVSSLILTAHAHAAAGVLVFDPFDFEVPEASTTVALTVKRTGGSDGPITVDYAYIGGSATPGADFVAVPPGTLSWPDGDSTPRTFSVTLIDDNVAESSEFVGFGLSNPTGGATLGPNLQITAILRISDVDVPPQGDIAFSPEYVYPNESSGTATLTVTRTGGTLGQVSVDYTHVEFSAVAGEDYVAVPPGTLTWPDGDGTPRTISVTLIDDSQYETFEALQFILSNVQGGARLVSGNGNMHFIDDDPPPSGWLNFGQSQVNVNEVAGTASFTVTRTGGTQGQVSVNYVDDQFGSATSGTDYVAIAPGTLTWPAGDASPRQVVVTLLDDDSDENTESIGLRLDQQTGGAILRAPTSAAVLIADDDPAPQLRIFDDTVTEANGAATDAMFGVSLLPASGKTVTVDYTTADATAVAPDDYLTRSGTLTFAPGITGMFVTVPVVGDTTEEPVETFSVGLASQTQSSLADAQAIGTIHDDDGIRIFASSFEAAP